MSISLYTVLRIGDKLEVVADECLLQNAVLIFLNVEWIGYKALGDW
jgi:hypothetical protein